MKVENVRHIFAAMCADVWKRACSPLALRAGSSGSIPVGKVCVNEPKCESELDAAADTGAVSSTQMLPLMVIQTARAKQHAVLWSMSASVCHLQSHI